MKKILVLLTLIISLTGCSKPVVFEEVAPVATSQDFKDNVDICYEIFPIAFSSSTGTKGDLKGITNKMDYLKELNVDCIWINPVHPSPTYHKYDVKDFYGIDPEFGTVEDYKQLLDVAHSKGIRVLMDFVINHTSYDHPWFQDALAKGKKSEYYDYYHFNNLKDKKAYPDRSGWIPYNDTFYFASFWEKMPELNYDNVKVRDEIKKTAKYWLDMGVDGFRIDAAKHVYDPREIPASEDSSAKNYQWFSEFNAYIKSVNPDSYMIGEVWTPNSTSSKYLVGMDSVFDFDYGTTLVNMFNKIDDRQMMDLLQKNPDTFGKVRQDYVEATFLTNHDQNRIKTTLGSDGKTKQAASILMTTPGTPWIYYGEELGYEGAKPDEQIREPFKWNDSNQAPNSTWEIISMNYDTPSLDKQRQDPNSYFNHYKYITSVRKNNDALKNGQFEVASAEDTEYLFGYYMTSPKQKLFVVHNIMGRDRKFDLNSEYKVVMQTGGVKVEKKHVVMPEYSSLVIDVTDMPEPKISNIVQTW